MMHRFGVEEVLEGMREVDGGGKEGGRVSE